MTDLEPLPLPPVDLRAWLLDLQKKKHTVKFGMSNGDSRRGRMIYITHDFILLSGDETATSKLFRGVAIAHIATIDPE